MNKGAMLMTAGICAVCGAALLAGDKSGGKAPDKRTRILEAARGELGKSDGRKYFDGVTAKNPGPTLPEWCGVFALWALHQAGLLRGVEWIYGKGFLFRLPTTRSPKPGDVAYFLRNQHHAIVERIEGPNVITIDGNHYGEVARVSRPISTVAAFYSIENAV